jgi:CheY-like chemotaxis protein
MGRLTFTAEPIMKAECGFVKPLYDMRQQGLTIPIVLLTGHPLDKDFDDPQTRGSSEWLLKPPDLENLAQTIARLLG